MGRTGPLPQPARLKRAKGETRTERLREGVTVRPGGPVMPSGMTPEAQAVWVQVVDAMEGSGVLAAADLHILRLFSVTYARWLTNSAILDQSGPLVRGANPSRPVLVRNPLSVLVREDGETCRLLARDLGLTPAARAAIRIDLTNIITASWDPMSDVIGPHPRARWRHGPPLADTPETRDWVVERYGLGYLEALDGGSPVVKG